MSKVSWPFVGESSRAQPPALRSFTTQRSSLVFGSESGPYCEMIPGSCHVTASCAPSTSIRPSAVLVVCTFQTTCAGCDGSKAAQDDNCDVTSALNSVATPGVGFVGARFTVQPPQFSCVEFAGNDVLLVSSCPTLTTAEVMRALAGIDWPAGGE